MVQTTVMTDFHHTEEELRSLNVFEDQTDSYIIEFDTPQSLD